MRTSNKILLAAGIGFFGIFILFPLIVLKTAVATPVSKMDTGSGIQNQVSRNYSIEDFTNLYFGGHWEVKIRQGAEFNVDISGSQSAVNQVEVERKGKTLRMKMRKDRSNLPSDFQNKLYALITLPRLLDLELDGLIRIDLVGFHEDHLKIKTDGYSEVSGAENSITDLSVNSDGLLRLAFTNNPVNNADLECEGMIDITLTMAGGDITGKIDGFGHFNYDGEVRNNRLKRSAWD